MNTTEDYLLDTVIDVKASVESCLGNCLAHKTDAQCARKLKTSVAVVRLMKELSQALNQSLGANPL